MFIEYIELGSRTADQSAGGGEAGPAASDTGD